jgi:hypothetical protein
MSNKNMKILMENFKHYEEQVMLEQKLTEIEETNEFKLYAEGKLNEEDFVAFLTESYGEILTEGVLDYLRGKGRKAAAGLALGAALMGAPGASAKAPARTTTRTHQVQTDTDQSTQGNFELKIKFALEGVVNDFAAGNKEAFNKSLKKFTNILKEAEANNLITNGQAKDIYSAMRHPVKGKTTSAEAGKTIDLILATKVREEVKFK